VSDLSSDRREGIGWHPRAVVEKYSADQTQWARAWLRRASLPARYLNGSWMRVMFASPEGGIAYDEGNGVVLAGRANLARLLTGEGGWPLEPGRACFGVGTDGATPFSAEHVHLSMAEGEDEGRALYLPMDPGFPKVTGSAVIEGQATFAEDDACFPWNEWCWATGGGRPKPGPVLRHVFDDGTHVMMNRKAPPNGLGTKDPGVAWCFRTEITVIG
jgi:hypothetical protein